MQARSSTISILVAVLWTLSLFYPGDSLAGNRAGGRCIAGTNPTLIFDMSANPGDIAVVAESKSKLASGGGNEKINTTTLQEFQVLDRDISQSPNALKLTVAEAVKDDSACGGGEDIDSESEDVDSESEDVDSESEDVDSESEDIDSESEDIDNESEDVDSEIKVCKATETGDNEDESDTDSETDDNENEDKSGADSQSKYLVNGKHLFDLERLRASADWMAQPGNLKPDFDVPNGSYGTIGFKQFLKNVQNSQTMYGIVRVKVPLELGGCLNTKGNCDRNALGKSVNSSDLYGFCQSTDGLCGCAPTKGLKIQGGKTLCGLKMQSTSQIRVKGSLFWDFVASTDSTTLKKGEAIPLNLLPQASRELFFRVGVPVMVNWAMDDDEDGAMDNMFNIAEVSSGDSTGELTAPRISWYNVPQSNKDDFEFYSGKKLTRKVFDELDNASKYHLMMPSGYPSGWAEAFDKLNITARIWKSIPVQPAFSLPEGDDDTIITAAAVRDQKFEDIPAYLYSGGLMDMHDHVNISGLVYAPQGMKLEAKGPDSSTRQYISGAVVAGDKFTIECQPDTIAVVSSAPINYSTARVEKDIINPPGGGGLSRSPKFAFSGPVAENTAEESKPSDADNTSLGKDLCFSGCTNKLKKSTDDDNDNDEPEASLWLEIRPMVPKQ